MFQQMRNKDITRGAVAERQSPEYVQSQRGRMHVDIDPAVQGILTASDVKLEFPRTRRDLQCAELRCELVPAQGGQFAPQAVDSRQQRHQPPFHPATRELA